MSASSGEKGLFVTLSRTEPRSTHLKLLATRQLPRYYSSKPREYLISAKEF
jgi:hypothetical protein